MSKTDSAADALELEPLVTRGHPVHTRIFSVELSRGEGAKLHALGKIIDMRKCGWVPTAGELQTAGFIHDMAIEAVVDRFGPEKHELAGRAKDMGSAAVFVALSIATLSWVTLIGYKFFA